MKVIFAVNTRPSLAYMREKTRLSVHQQQSTHTCCYSQPISGIYLAYISMHLQHTRHCAVTLDVALRRRILCERGSTCTVFGDILHGIGVLDSPHRAVTCDRDDCYCTLCILSQQNWTLVAFASASPNVDRFSECFHRGLRNL